MKERCGVCQRGYEIVGKVEHDGTIYEACDKCIKAYAGERDLIFEEAINYLNKWEGMKTFRPRLDGAEMYIDEYGRVIASILDAEGNVINAAHVQVTPRNFLEGEEWRLKA